MYGSKNNKFYAFDHLKGSDIHNELLQNSSVNFLEDSNSVLVLVIQLKYMY